MAGTPVTFGRFVRDARLARRLGLREMAAMLGMSPTYLSQIERDVFAPPTEERVRAIAQVLGCDVDALLGLARRVPTDVAEILHERPAQFADLLRTARNLTPKDLDRLIAQARKAGKS